MLDLHLIRIDGGTQSRANLNEEVVAEYAEAYKAGAEFPAVTVFYDGKDRWLADGFHRYFAAKKAGKKSILEKITPGTKRDAILFSLGANGTHGLNRTNADKRNAVETMLKDPEWAAWSDNAIAKACHVSHPFVGSVRASILKPLQDAPTTRTVERNGKTYEQNTANIGKLNPLVQAHRDLSKAAHEADVARGGDGNVAKTEVVQQDEDYSGPDESELASVAASEKAEADAMRLLLESDAPLADVTEKYKQSLIQISMLEARIVGLQNENMVLVRTVKSVQNKLKRLEQPA